jgi:flavodoxin
VEIRFLRTVSRLEGDDGRVRRVALTKTRQRRADRRPRTMPDAPEMLDVSLVVMAMGYRQHPALASMLPGTPLAREAHGLPDRRWMASGIFANPAPKFAHGKPVGQLALGKEAGLTASALQLQERLWASGDALVGPSTVVEAMAQGRRAAASVIAASPSRGDRREPRRVLIAYESRGGNTARAAQEVAEGLRRTGAVVRTLPLRQATLAELTDTDLLVVGTWVEGFVVTRVQAASATRMWLDGLPRLPGLRAATFCTFAVSPKQTLAAMRHELEERGMSVLAEGAFGPGARNIGSNAARFTEDLLAAAWPGGVPDGRPEPGTLETAGGTR